MVIAASIGFIVNYSTLGKSPKITEVLSEYGTALVPIAFAQAMCGVVAGAFGVFLIYALRRHKRRQRLIDELTVGLAICTVLAASWAFAFRHGEIMLSVALAGASVVLSCAMFVRVANTTSNEHPGWLRAPFGLHFGAMTVAFLVALTQWLNASEILAATAITRRDEAAALMAIGALAGGLIALRYGDIVYPVVIASCAGAMFVAQRTSDPALATVALLVCVVMLVVAGLGAIARARRRARNADGGALRRSVKSARESAEENRYLTGPTTSVMRH